MTAVGFGEEYVVVDMGFRLDSILGFEDVDIGAMELEELVSIRAIPDDSALEPKRVKAIVLTHGHLDHIGAVGKLAHKYDAPIIGTPFTVELVKRVIREERVFGVSNELRGVKLGETVEVGEIKLEFIAVTHSIPQTALVALHGPGGSVLFASDFKLDEEPLVGSLTDLARLRKLASEGLLACLVGAVRVDEPGPTKSESAAKQMLKQVMEGAIEREGAVIVTTFSSHIVRLKSIIDLSQELGRTPLVVGRSLSNYCSAALRLGLVEFPEEVKIHGRRSNAVKNVLREVEEARDEFVLVVTGHQGEPTSILTRIADGKLPFRIRKGDEVIFSASVIPNPVNESNRLLLETKLKAQGARVHRDVHVSGHAGRKDTAEFLRLVSPEHLVPCHGTLDKLGIVSELGRELGYSRDQIHLLKNGEGLRLEG